jgi:hypothetical protein
LSKDQFCLGQKWTATELIFDNLRMTEWGSNNLSGKRSRFHGNLFSAAPFITANSTPTLRIIPFHVRKHISNRTDPDCSVETSLKPFILSKVEGSLVFLGSQEPIERLDERSFRFAQDEV